jgi:hypothetical protein
MISLLQCQLYSKLATLCNIQCFHTRTCGFDLNITWRIVIGWKFDVVLTITWAGECRLQVMENNETCRYTQCALRILQTQQPRHLRHRSNVGREVCIRATDVYNTGQLTGFVIFLAFHTNDSTRWSNMARPQPSKISTTEIFGGFRTGVAEDPFSCDRALCHWLITSRCFEVVSSSSGVDMCKEK